MCELEFMAEQYPEIDEYADVDPAIEPHVEMNNCVNCDKMHDSRYSSTPFCCEECEDEFWSWQMTPRTLKCALACAMFFIKENDEVPF